MTYNNIFFSKATLLGHSLGGAIAAHTAGHESVVALVLVSSAGPFAHKGHFPRTYRFLAPFTRFGATRRLLIAMARPALSVAGYGNVTSAETVVTSLQAAAEIRFARHGETLKLLGKPTFVAWA